MDPDELRVMIERYFATLHCTLWGQHFDIIAIDSHERAVNFLAEAIEGVLATNRAHLASTNGNS